MWILRKVDYGGSDHGAEVIMMARKIGGEKFALKFINLIWGEKGRAKMTKLKDVTTKKIIKILAR